MDDFFGTDKAEADPMAEFLAREQAILGDDAALFANETPQSITSPTPQKPAQDLGFTDFLSDSSQQQFSQPAQFPSQPTNGFGDFNDFESTPNQGAQGFQPSFQPNASTPASLLPEPEVEVEPDCIRMWRIEFEETIQARDSKSKARRDNTLKEAKESLERFYAEYNDKKEKNLARNKSLEKNAEPESTNVWERIVQNIDVKTSTAALSSRDQKLKDKLQGKEKKTDEKKKAPATKGKDRERMKQLLISLKKDPKAPGVTSI